MKYYTCKICGAKGCFWHLCNTCATSTNKHIVERRHKIFETYKHGGARELHKKHVAYQPHYTEDI